MVGKNKKTENQVESIEQTKQIEKNKKANKKVQKETNAQRDNKKRKINKNGKSLAEKKYNDKIKELHKRYPEIKYPTEIKDIVNDYNVMNELMKKLRPKIMSLRQHYLHDVTKIEKTKRIKKANRSGNGGFKGKHVLPEDLAEFLDYGTDEKIELTIPELTKRFWEIVRKKGLVYEKDGRIFRPNEELKKIFNLPDSVDTSTNFNDRSGFNFTTLQRYFSQKLKETEGKEEKPSKEVQDKKPVKKPKKNPQPVVEDDDDVKSEDE